MFHTAIRAGHDLSYEMGRSFEYIQCAERTVAVGGIALGGYVNSLVRPSRASLCFYSSLPETMQQTLDNQPDGRFVFRTIIDDDFLLRIMNYSDN